MLKVAFVAPNDEYNFEPFRNQPLVGLYLLTILEKHFGDKIELSLIDLRGIKKESILYYIPENDVYLHTAITPDFLETADVVKKIRTVYPNAKHIAGGPHVNIFPEESAKVFDTIVLAEGEEIVKQIINDILNSKLKPVYKNEKPIDINAYPYPSRKYLPKTAVIIKNLLEGYYRNLKGTSVLFSRGCPFSCHFCSNKEITFGPVRFRSPELVKEEIEYLKREYGIEAIAIKDDNSIPVNRSIAKPFLTAIKETDIKWRGQSRANGIPPDIVKLAKESGCTHIAIGIESASTKVLENVNKKINLDKAKDYIYHLKKNGIGVRLHFIIGLPGEPDDIVKKTMKFLNEAEPDSVLLSLFCPVPGSETFKNPGRFGIKLDSSMTWDIYRTAFGRFDENELPTMVFEYEKTTPFGKGMKNETIVQNYIELQANLRDHGLIF